MKFRLKQGTFLMRDAFDLREGHEQVHAVWHWPGGHEDDMLTIAWDSTVNQPAHTYSHREGFGADGDEVVLDGEGEVSRFSVMPLTDLQIDMLTVAAHHGAFQRLAAKLWERTHAPA